MNEEPAEVKPSTESADPVMTATNETKYSIPAVPKKREYHLREVGMNQYQSATGSMYSFTPSGNLVKINKNNNPSKRDRAKMKRLAKRENQNKKSN